MLKDFVIVSCPVCGSTDTHIDYTKTDWYFFCADCVNNFSVNEADFEPACFEIEECIPTED